MRRCHPGYLLLLTAPGDSFDLLSEPDKSLVVFRDVTPVLQLAAEALSPAWGGAPARQLLTALQAQAASQVAGGAAGAAAEQGTARGRGRGRGRRSAASGKAFVDGNQPTAAAAATPGADIADHGTSGAAAGDGRRSASPDALFVEFQITPEGGRGAAGGKASQAVAAHAATSCALLQVNDRMFVVL